jgi:hypothetical protein
LWRPKWISYGTVFVRIAARATGVARKVDGQSSIGISVCVGTEIGGTSAAKAELINVINKTAQQYQRIFGSVCLAARSYEYAVQAKK